MANERNTENLVRDILRELNYYSEPNTIVEEQRSNIEEIKKLLKGASKTGNGGIGAPEFIITTMDTPDFVIIFECKADTNKHFSENLDRPVDYAVDGVLHYASALSESFNVIAIAVSGETKDSLKISNFIYPKGASHYKELRNKNGQVIKSIISFSDYIEHGTLDPEVAQKRHNDLMEFSRELHNFMRDHAKLTESEKPLLVSGTLIALRNKAFSISYDAYKPDELQKEWMRVIKEEFKKAEIPNSKEFSMTQPYTSIGVHPNLGKSDKKYPKGVLHELIRKLGVRVWPFISIYHDFDVVGQFYGEFLKYTGGDKKALGIVLTPRHITELFTLLANVQKDSKVVDICAGTGGFLISAMHQMIKKAETQDDIERIKKECLIGVENQPQMYALAASNMILRGDGKANLHQGSCFDEAISKEIKSKKCNIGFLNPPYSQSDEDLHELVFVKHLLDCLDENSTGVVIVPISCAISQHPKREEILKHHTLDAVMSLPTDLFYPVGTVPCIMIFKAHIPHENSNTKTWFGFWKDDGFVKTKHLGRIDSNNKWDSIKKHWVDTYRNRESIPGECIKYNVTANDEWCAEAYMETDYRHLSIDEFKQNVLSYLSFSLMQQDFESLKKFINNKPSEIELFSNREWKWFELEKIFDLKKGKRLTKSNMTFGETPFIGSIDSNNGYREYIGQKPNHNGNTITVNYNGSVGESFYQPKAFWASDDVNVLYPKFEMNEYIALFIVTIIKLEKYRFNYGRKWHLERMKKSEIKLPTLENGSPDYNFMEKFIKSIDYSKKLSFKKSI
jgi:type I restriction enzyme M protein